MSAVENFGQHRDALMRTSAVRASNDHIARRAEALRFTSRVPLLCECDDPGCQALILVSLDDFRRLRRRGDAVITGDHARFRRGA